MFYGEKRQPKGRWEFADPFVACTVAFGHPPFLLSYSNVAYGYFMVQALAARYTQADVASIRYADAGGKFHPTSQAVASGDYRRSQIAVRYSDGTETFVNGSRDGEWLAVERGKGKIVLPPYGFFGEGKGVCSFNGVREGVRMSFACGPEYSYICSREKKWIETPGGGTDGEMVRLFGRDGTEEVIPFGAEKMMLPYAAVRITGLDKDDSKAVGEVPFKVDAKGHTIFEVQKNAYSYRVTRPVGWREPDVSDYVQAAVSAQDSVVEVDEKVCRRLPMPYIWRKGMVRRGSNAEVPVEASTGARIDWSGMANEGVWRATLSFHPPFKRGTGYVFAKYRIKIPKEGATFSAKIAKGLGSVRGDGVLFRTLVREGKNSPLECVAERVVDDYVWHDFKADLSRWAGRTVDFYLVGDPGTSNNTYGDSGGWADLHLERRNRMGDVPRCFRKNFEK